MEINWNVTNWLWNYSYVNLVKNCCLAAGTAANQAPTFTITDTQLDVPVVTLST